MASVSSGLSLDGIEYNWLNNVSFHVESEYDGHSAEITVRLSQDAGESTVSVEPSDDRPVELPFHPHALITDPEHIQTMLNEIPYCMFKNYQVQKHMIDVGDKDSMYRFGSCIIYLTAFCGRIAYENRSWFDLPMDVEFYGSGEKQILKQAHNLGFEVKSTVWAETLRWIRSLGNIWRTNVPYVTGIDICEGARGLYTLPGSKIDPKMISLVRKSPYMLEWAERHMYFDGFKPTPFLSRNKAEKWSDITKITTLQWNVATDANELLRWCVRMVCLSMDFHINYIEKEKTRGTKARKAKTSTATGATTVKKTIAAKKTIKSPTPKKRGGSSTPLIKVIRSPHGSLTPGDGNQPRSPRLVVIATSPDQRRQIQHHIDHVSKVFHSPQSTYVKRTSPLRSEDISPLVFAEEEGVRAPLDYTSPEACLKSENNHDHPSSSHHVESQQHTTLNTSQQHLQKDVNSVTQEPMPHDSQAMFKNEASYSEMAYVTPAPPRRRTRLQARQERQQQQLMASGQTTLDNYFPRLTSPHHDADPCETPIKSSYDTTSMTMSASTNDEEADFRRIPPSSPSASPFLQSIQQSIRLGSPVFVSPVITRRVTRHMVRMAVADATCTVDASTRVLSPYDQQKMSRTSSAVQRRVATRYVKRSAVPVGPRTRSRRRRGGAPDDEQDEDIEDNTSLADEELIDAPLAESETAISSTTDAEQLPSPAQQHDSSDAQVPHDPLITTQDQNVSPVSLSSATPSSSPVDHEKSSSTCTTPTQLTTDATAMDASHTPIIQPPSEETSHANTTPMMIPLYEQINFNDISYPNFTPTVQKTGTITTLHESMVYCVTHIILVLSEFGSRPILRKQCSQQELEYLSALLARWLLYIARDYPVSHPLNREIVTEIVCSLYIAKHNGVTFTPMVLRAMIATVELCLYDANTRNTDALRNGPCTGKQCTYIPLICYNQGKGQADASFAQYHTHFLIGLLYQLAIVDGYGGNGSVNNPELDLSTSEDYQNHQYQHDHQQHPSNSDLSISISHDYLDDHQHSHVNLSRCSITPDTTQYAYLYHHINIEYAKYTSEPSPVPQYNMDAVTKSFLNIKRSSSSDHTTYPTGFANIFSPDLYNPQQCTCVTCTGLIVVIPRLSQDKCQQMCFYTRHATTSLCGGDQHPGTMSSSTPHDNIIQSSLRRDVSALYHPLQPYAAAHLHSKHARDQVFLFQQQITDVYSRYKLWTDSYLQDPSQTRLKLLPLRSGGTIDMDGEKLSSSMLLPNAPLQTDRTDFPHVVSPRPSRSRKKDVSDEIKSQVTEGGAPPPPQLNRLRQLLITSYFTQYQPSLISEEGFGQSKKGGNRKK